MAFWSDNKINLKRNFLFLGEINFYNVDDNGLTFSEGGINQFLIHSYQKPKLVTNIDDLGGQNALNGRWNYQIESIGWDALTIKVYDTFGNEDSLNSNTTIFSWLKGLGYSPATFSSIAGAAFAGGDADVPSFITKLSQGNAVTLSITVIDDKGSAVEKFTYVDPILAGIDFGEASYDSDSLPLITLTFNIAAVDHTTGAGIVDVPEL